MTAGFPEAYAGPVDLPLSGAPLGVFERLYGPVPPPPARLGVSRRPLGPGVERVSVTVALPCGKQTVEAALWRPDGPEPFPLIIGLDFLGPVGVLPGEDFPLDPGAVICAPSGTEPMNAAHRGATAWRWPVKWLCDQGFAVLMSCYGSWVPDDPSLWRARALGKQYGGVSGAISLWAWALLRMVDVAERLGGVDQTQIACVGHSRLGKAALWAAAQDERIASVWANQSGACGASPEAHAIGETRAQLKARFPHWLAPEAALHGADQQDLLFHLRGKQVFLSAAREDLWGDPLGCYRAMCAASERNDWPEVEAVWRAGGIHARGDWGWFLRDGRHDMLPDDWRAFVGFIRRFRR